MHGSEQTWSTSDVACVNRLAPSFCCHAESTERSHLSRDKKSEEKSAELKPDEFTPSLNQPILEEINPEYPLEGLMLKLKLQ